MLILVSFQARRSTLLLSPHQTEHVLQLYSTAEYHVQQIHAKHFLGQNLHQLSEAGNQASDIFGSRICSCESLRV